MSNDLQKQAAARASMNYVQDGNIVGLGSGSTATCAIHLLAERVRDGLNIRGIPSSRKTAELASSLGIPLATLDEFPEIDVTIDGADEIDPQLQLIKGGGGAFLREKIVASASRRLVIIADSTKMVPLLGRAPLPVEAVCFAQALVKKKIEDLGATITVRRDPSGKPSLTDEGHHVLDCHFGKIPDPAALSRNLNDIPGLVEHGLFVNMADIVLIGDDSGVEELHAHRNR
jgi:ribose 5-phosphate isomerase A